MSLSSHLSQLKQKHQTLSQQIEEEQARPAADEFAIAEMKRRKLLIKDEIVRLGGDTRH